MKNETYLVELNKFANDIYPKTEEEATAERIIRFSTARALWLWHSLNVMETIVEGKVDEKWLRTLEAMQGEYDKRVLLSALMKVAPAKADEVARDSWLAADADDSCGEWLWEWAIESDIPVSPESLDGKTQAEAKAEMVQERANWAKRESNTEKVMGGLQRHYALLSEGVDIDWITTTIEKEMELALEDVRSGLNYLYTEGAIEPVQLEGVRCVRWAREVDDKS